jgi:hypothetical protein
MLPQCERCRVPYHPESSSSALRNTYCGTLCEQAALGFSIVGFIRSDIRPRAKSLDELMPAEWLDEVLAGLPADEAVAAGAEPGEGPLGFKPDWKLYGPLR